MPGCDLLLTGAGGFVGGHVAARAGSQGLEVGTAEGDLRDAERVDRSVQQLRPDAVIHLASSWRRNARSPWTAFADDVAMVGAVIEAVSRHAPDAVVLVVGTAAQYGLGLPRPLREDDQLEAVSPYGAAKNALEQVVTAGPLSAEVRVIFTRSFNHVGPGQELNAPLPQWAVRVVEAERRGGGTVATGRLDVVRDVLDVRDVADAYLSLVRSPSAAGVYNVCSGTAVRMGDLLDLLIADARVPVHAEQDPQLFRASDPAMVVGDNTRLRDATGWQPRIDVRQSVRDVLEEWRAAPDLSVPTRRSGAGA